MNVAEQANKFLDFVKDGLNGIQVIDLRKECTWHEQYAIFILQFDTYGDGDLPPYHEFNLHQFEQDLDKCMKSFFPDCEINYSSGCFEYEIIGPKYLTFAKKHADALEEFECIEGGHKIFVP